MNRFKSKQMREAQMPVVLMGAGLVALIVVFLVFFSKDSDSDTELRGMEERFQSFEQEMKDHFNRLEVAQKREIKMLSNRITALEHSLRSSASSEPVERRVDSPAENVREKPVAKPAEDSRQKPSDTAAAPSASSVGSKPKSISVKEAVKSSKKPARKAAQYHVVADGETLYTIARRYGLKIEELQKFNNLNDKIIHPGQKLLVSSP